MSGWLRRAVLVLVLCCPPACAPPERGGSEQGRTPARSTAGTVVVQTTADFSTNANREYGLDWENDKLTRRKTSSALSGFSDLGRDTSPARSGTIGAGMVALGGYLYLLGSDASIAPINPGVIGAPINASGSIGSWATAGGQISVSGTTNTEAVAGYNGYIYLLYKPPTGNTLLYSAQQNPADGTLSAFTQRNQITGQVQQVTRLVASGNTLYATDQGTVSGTPADSKFFYAHLNADGSAGTWQSGPTSPLVQNVGSMFAWAGRLYAFGSSGQCCSGKNAITASLGLDGSVSAWTQVTSPAYTFSSLTWALDSAVYSMSGGSCNGASCHLNRAPLSLDGTIGAMTTLAGSWPAAQLDRDPWTVYGSSVYVTRANGTTSTSILKAQLSTVDAPAPSADTVTGWTSPGALPALRSNLASAAANGYLYVTGGKSGSTVLGDVKFVAAGGAATGNFRSNPNAFTPARQNHALVTQGGRLYVIGGATDAAGTTATTSIQWATLIPSGTSAGSTGNFSAARDLPAARTGAAAVMINDKLYVIGGEVAGVPTGTVLVSTIDASGNLGAWDTSSVSLTQARTRHAAFSYGGKLYVLGGSDGTNPLGDVQVGAIGAGGAVTGWTATSAFTPARSGFSAVAHDGVAALFGGRGAETDVQVAQVNADGSLGAWTAGTALPSAGPNLGRSDFGAAYEAGNLYLLGGLSGSTQQDSVTVGSFILPLARGAWSKRYDLGAPVALSGFTVDGVLSGQGAVRAEFEAAGADGVFGARTRVDSVTPGVAVPLNLTNTRYLWLRLTLDDTLSAVGDSLISSDQSTITKVTLTTVANPPATIAVTSGAQTLTAGVCSAVVTGTLKDSNGTPTLAVSDVVVTPSATPSSGVTFYSDAACATPATTQTIASGAGTVSLYFKATVAGSLTLGLGTASLGSGGQVQLINAAKGTKLAFSVQPSAATVGVVITPAIKVLVQDPFGNTDPTATGTLTLGYTGGTSNLSGTTTAAVIQGLATWNSVSPNIPGTFTLTADDRDGVAPLYTAATSNNFTVTAASSATKLAFTTAAQSPPVGTCSTVVTVQSQLASGGFANQPTALPLALSAPNTAFFTDALCATPLTGPAIASGASSLDFYVIGNAVGAVTLTAHSNGQALTDATQQWSIVAQNTGSDGGTDAGSDGGSDAGSTPDAGPVSLKGGVNGFTCASGGAGPESLLPLLAGLVLVPALRRRRSARSLARSGVALLLALCAALVSPARAEEPEQLVKEATPAPFKPVTHLVIALVDFTRSESFKETKDSEAIDRYYLADAVRGAAVSELPRAMVMNKEQNATMLALNSKDLGACDKLCQVETGRLLGADYVISGDLTRFGSAIKLVLKIHGTAAGNLMGSGTAEGKTLDELDKTIKPAVKELLKTLIAKAEEERQAEEEAKAQAKAEKLAEVEATAKAKALAAEHREDLARAKRDGELQEASRSGAQAARSRTPVFGVYGGTVVDAREKSFGLEAALVLDFSPLRFDVGLAIADHLGLRAGMLFPIAYTIELGPRVLVTPLDGGTLVAGGLGLRWDYRISTALHLQLGLAGEYYKYPSGYTNSGLGVLATAGLELMLF